MRVHFVTLGCAKNRVDSELILGALAERGGQFTDDPQQADILVVNTCGFIDEAKQESIDVICELAEQKAGHQKLVVTGCLAQRYPDALRDEIPEIDALLGNGAYETIAAWASSVEQAPLVDVRAPTFRQNASQPRINTFAPHSAYMKISEGCDQKCSFCIIPSLRGTQRSRSIADLVLEAQTLRDRGVVELNLIAQDLTGYGTDLKPRAHLADLLEALGAVDGIQWIRLHYAYPRPFSKALVRAIRDVDSVVPYLDMPLQHISDPILRRMRRGRPRRFVEALLDELRSEIPDLVLRTSFIVGFPGETEADFESLCQFIKAQAFDRVGVFRFSREEGTASYNLDGQVPTAEIEARYEHLMGRLRAQSKERQKAYLGRRIEVLVDGPSPETPLLLAGRHTGQAPEVDGTTYINDGQAEVGDLVEVEVTDTFDYDLVGHITRILRRAPPRPAHAQLGARPPSAPRTGLPVLG